MTPQSIIADTVMTGGCKWLMESLRRREYLDPDPLLVFPDTLKTNNFPVVKQILNIAYKHASLPGRLLTSSRILTGSATAQFVCGAMLFSELMTDINIRKVQKVMLNITFNKNFAEREGVLYYEFEEQTPDEIMRDMIVFYMKG